MRASWAWACLTTKQLPHISTPQNIGGENAGDAFYRYKMPKLMAKVRGGGGPPQVVQRVNSWQHSRSRSRSRARLHAASQRLAELPPPPTHTPTHPD